MTTIITDNTFSNADGVVSPLTERIYFGMNFGNVVKNIATLAALILSLAGKAYAGASQGVGAIVPGISIINGTLYVVTGLEGNRNARKSNETSRKLLILEEDAQVGSKMALSEGDSQVNKGFTKAQELFAKVKRQALDPVEKTKTIELAHKIFKRADRLFELENLEKEKPSSLRQAWISRKTTRLMEAIEEASLPADTETEPRLSSTDPTHMTLFPELNHLNETFDTKINRLATRKLQRNSEKWGHRNWKLFMSVGITQIGFGLISITSLLAPIINQAVLHTALLTTHVAQKVLVALGTFFLSGMGLAYVVRGGIMLYRACQDKELHTDARKELETIFKNHNMSEEESKEAIRQFLDRNCAMKEGTEVDAGGNHVIINSYTGQPISEIDNLESMDAINQYLQTLDEGIHNEILKQEVAQKIGASMIVGGCLTVIAAFLSGGTSIIGVGIASSLIFVFMEGTFLRYDSSAHFKAYVHKHYEQPTYLQNKNTKICGIDTDLFKQYQTDLYWIPSRNPYGREVSVNDQVSGPEFELFGLLKSAIFPLFRYEKYKELKQPGQTVNPPLMESTRRGNEILNERLRAQPTTTHHDKKPSWLETHSHEVSEILLFAAICVLATTLQG